MKNKKSEKRASQGSKKTQTNYWIISTVVLAIILSVTLLMPSTSSTSVSAETAGQNVLDFALSQGAQAELVSTSDDGSLYEVVLSIEGQEVPVYVTKDGKTLVPQPIPLTTSDDTSKTNTPSTPTPTNIPKAEKPIVEAFVMSHCPYGTQIEKGLIPVVNALGDTIDFKIKFVYYAMHPTYGEVEEQLRQYCIQEEQNDKYIDYLTCFLGKTGTAEDAQSCLEETGVDTAALATCEATTDEEYNVMANLENKDSWLNGRFPLFDINKEDNEKYSVGGSPTLVINGVTAQAGRDSISLLAAICASFENAPEECNTEFEAVSPSPGFGWEASETANNAAACGV